MADFNRLFTPKTKKEMVSHGTFKITWIHYSKLERSIYQYCDGKEKEIENLADMISGSGKVLQSLIVRESEDGNYEIVAGHKRCAAVKLLVEKRGLKKYAMLPCVISSENEAKIRYTVISSNAHHQKTPYEIMHELQELEYLIRNFPDEFPDLNSGRMVERLSKKTGIAKSVVGEYQSIAKNLSKRAMDKFKHGELDKSAASALAGLPVNEQDQLLKASITRSKDIKAYKKKKGKKISKLTSKDEQSKVIEYNHAESPIEEIISKGDQVYRKLTSDGQVNNNEKIFTCTWENDDWKKCWKGKLLIKCKTSCGYEVEISREGSSFYAVIGQYSYGNYICIPSLDKGCALADFSDFFWNKERLSRVMKTLDAVTIATALKYL